MHASTTPYTRDDHSAERSRSGSRTNSTTSSSSSSSNQSMHAPSSWNPTYTSSSPAYTQPPQDVPWTRDARASGRDYRFNNDQAFSPATDQAPIYAEPYGADSVPPERAVGPPWTPGPQYSYAPAPVLVSTPPAQYPYDEQRQGVPQEDYSKTLAIEQFLRAQVWLQHVPRDQPITLDIMPDAVGRSRPQSPLWQLAAVAIFSLPGHRAKSRDIRAALQNRFPYFRNNGNELAESLKHALSSRHLFVNQPTEPYDGQKRGKGGYWALDVFTNPMGTRPRTGKRMNSQRSGESDSALVNTPEHSNAEQESMQY